MWPFKTKNKKEKVKKPISCIVKTILDDLDRISAHDWTITRYAGHIIHYTFSNPLIKYKLSSALDDGGSWFVDLISGEEEVENVFTFHESFLISIKLKEIREKQSNLKKERKEAEEKAIRDSKLKLLFPHCFN